MQHDLSLLFFLRKAQTDKGGLSPIYFRITVNGKRAELSINRKIEAIRWDSNSQRAKGRSESSRTLNEYIDGIENSVRKEFNKLLDSGKPVSADLLRDIYNGVNKRDYFLVEVFEMNNNLIAQEEGDKYTLSTINQYKTTLARLKRFLSEEMDCDDIAMSKLDILFIRKFDIFLKSNFKLDHNTVVKQLKQLKKVVHFAMSLGYIDKDPFLQHKTTYKEASRGYLTMDELNAIENHTFRLRRLDQVRDVFVFVCYTGLAYADLKLFNQNNIRKGIDGKEWIIYEREKTGVCTTFPLLPAAKRILDKYKNDPECNAENKLLPINSNQKLNSYLLEIAELCEVNKHITMHIGRHTFATSVTLTLGVPIETVSKMLGHTSLKTTQIYSKVVDNKVSNDMNKLAEILEAKDSIPLSNETSFNLKIAL